MDINHNFAVLCSVAECETINIYTKRNEIEEVVLWSVYYKNKIEKLVEQFKIFHVF